MKNLIAFAATLPLAVAVLGASGSSRNDRGSSASEPLAPFSTALSAEDFSGNLVRIRDSRPAPDSWYRRAADVSKQWNVESCAVATSATDTAARRTRLDCGCTPVGNGTCNCGAGGVRPGDLEAGCFFDPATCNILCSTAAPPSAAPILLLGGLVFAVAASLMLAFKRRGPRFPGP